MCGDLMLWRKPSVLKTSINIITTTATPTLRTRRSRTSEGEDRSEGPGAISHRVRPEPAIGPARGRTRWAGPMINSAHCAIPVRRVGDAAKVGGGAMRCAYCALRHVRFGDKRLPADG